MNREEFEKLRALPGKRITADIQFRSNPMVAPNYIFEQIPVQNDLGWDVSLNGTFKPGIPSLTFNFVLKNTGPICRIDVNGPIHKDSGRTHKHELLSEDDPQKNLPIASSRQDLSAKKAREVWVWLCREGNIIHEGNFFDPEGGVSPK